jgi:gamma-glutamyltranspeptidase/glutathione hydrolase
MRHFLILSVLLAALPAMGGDRPGDPAFQSRSPAVGRQGMAATASPLATEAAVAILKAGGSAVDAAIAANAVLGLVEPTGNGIGGDLFALVWDPKAKRVLGLDASGAAPAGLDVAGLTARHPKGFAVPVGMDTVTMPGAVAGWEALHRRYGRLPLAQVLAPAVSLARAGFAVSPVIARGWALNLRRFGEAKAEIEDFDGIARLYAPAGRAPAAGEAFANPDLAATLELIGREGANGFYRGALARDLEAHFRRHGRGHAAADLAAVTAEWVEPISVGYRGHRVYQMPPATQGLTTLQMLKMVEQFPMATLSEADRLHVIVEAKKLAFADRARFLADPRRAKVPVAGLLDDAYLKARAGRIAMDRALPDETPPGAPEGADTTYLATADASGMMVSLIQSNYAGMGSGVVVPRSKPVPGGRGSWGFMLQNRGAQFALDPASPNAIAPGKRPFHTIIPGFVTKAGQPFLAYGVMGGTMQPQGHVQVLVNLIDRGLNLQAAGDAPRVRHLGGADPGADGREPTPGLFLESGIGPETRASLAARGHRLIDQHRDVGGYQAVMWDAATGSWWGATEMRKDGVALGY